MVGALLTSLAAGGLSNLASSIFEGIVGEGEEIVKDFMEDKLGIEVDFSKPLTEGDIALFKHKEALLIQELSELKERNRHEELMLTNELEYSKLEVEDVKSARVSNMEYSKSGHWLVANFLPLFSIFIMSMIGYSMLAILTMEPASMNERIATQIMEFDKIIGTLVIGFWFGSSYGSKRKDESLINTASKKNEV